VVLREVRGGGEGGGWGEGGGGGGESVDVEGQRFGIISDQNGNNKMNIRVMKRVVLWIFKIEN